jgi:hypothetical protein
MAGGPSTIARFDAVSILEVAIATKNSLTRLRKAIRAQARCNQASLVALAAFLLIRAIAVVSRVLADSATSVKFTGAPLTQTIRGFALPIMMLARCVVNGLPRVEATATYADVLAVLLHFTHILMILPPVHNSGNRATRSFTRSHVSMIVIVAIDVATC